MSITCMVTLLVCFNWSWHLDILSAIEWNKFTPFLRGLMTLRKSGSNIGLEELPCGKWTHKVSKKCTLALQHISKCDLGQLILFCICYQHSPWFSGMTTNVLKDADRLQRTYLTLLTNQSEASAWTGRVMESVMEIIMKVCLHFFSWW